MLECWQLKYRHLVISTYLLTEHRTCFRSHFFYHSWPLCHIRCRHIQLDGRNDLVHIFVSAPIFNPTSHQDLPMTFRPGASRRIGFNLFLMFSLSNFWLFCPNSIFGWNFAPRNFLQCWVGFFWSSFPLRRLIVGSYGYTHYSLQHPLWRAF